MQLASTTMTRRLRFKEVIWREGGRGGCRREGSLHNEHTEPSSVLSSLSHKRSIQPSFMCAVCVYLEIICLLFGFVCSTVIGKRARGCCFSWSCVSPGTTSKGIVLWCRHQVQQCNVHGDLFEFGGRSKGREGREPSKLLSSYANDSHHRKQNLMLTFSWFITSSSSINLNVFVLTFMFHQNAHCAALLFFPPQVDFVYWQRSASVIYTKSYYKRCTSVINGVSMLFFLHLNGTEGSKKKSQTVLI